MPEIIKNDRIVEDAWSALKLGEQDVAARWKVYEQMAGGAAAEAAAVQ